MSALSAGTGGPGGAGGTSPFGTPVATQLDPFTGAMTVTIPIAVPPGRKGMQPDIALTYFSGRANGWVGVGWQLEPGAIERQTKFGVDYTKDDYVLRLNGSSQELVQLSPGGADFRAKIEGGFLRIKKLSFDGTSGWEVTDPRGVKYFFGRAADTRRAHPQYPTTKIFTWFLERIEDPHGNYVKLLYWTDSANNEVYLDEIRYTGTGTTDGPHSMKFYLEDRPDAPPMYVGNYLIKTAKRLRTIEVKALGSMVRAYKLAYTIGAATSRSVLLNLYQFGRDATINGSGEVTGGTALPPLTMNCQGGGLSFSNALFDRTGIGVNDYTKVFSGDFNGDGKADIAALHHNDTPGYSWVAFSNSDGTFNKVLFDRTGIGVNDSTLVFPGDFNGDGKTDIAAIHHNDTPGWSWVAFSHGDGTFNKVLFDRTGIGANDSTLVFPGDFNGDGRSDIAAIHQDGSVGYSWTAFSNGDGTYNKVLFNRSGIETNPYTKVFPGDFNGDGKADIAALHHNDTPGYSWLATASGPIPDLLAGLNNGIGGTTTIAYQPSTQFTNTLLPYPVQVVSSLTTNDGNGNVATTNYTYSGGFHHIAERDFRGFYYVTAAGPVGPNGEQQVTETWFHQGNDWAIGVNNPNVPHGYMKGKPYWTRTKDASGYIWTDTAIVYAPDADNTAPWFTPPNKVLAAVCNGTGTSCTSLKETRTDLIYDHTYGNVMREDQYGDTSTSADDRTIVRTFSPNATDWIISLPATETIYAGIGTTTQKAQTTFYYDGTTSCGTASTNQTPTKGLLTRVVRWLNGGTNPETRLAYDSYGNQTCVRDPRGNTSTIAYDSGTNTFPLTVTNALGHVTTTAYYGVNGVVIDSGLFGQVKTVTDPNGRTASSTYDTFGRPSTSTAPNGLVTTTTYNSLGTVGSQHVLSSRTVGGVNFQSWTYFDGLGRTIKAKSTGPQTPSAQNIVTQTVYNVRGQVAQSSLPFFEGGTPLWRTMTYDPLGRVKTVTTPDGKVTTTCYDPWVTVVINPKSQKKRQVADAYGRTLTVQEYTGSHDPGQCSAAVGSPYATTSYAYDVLGNLTSVTDALGNQTTMTYDTLSHKTAMHDPDMGNWSYVYDAAGNLIQQTDAKGQTIFFQYDALNRRRQKDFGTQKALGSGDVVYTYDGATANNLVGRLAQVADSTGTVTFQYDVLGQISSSTRTLFTTPYTFSYTRDTLSRLATITYPDNSVLTYTYNGPFADQVKEGSTVYAQYHSYNALGQPVSVAYSNGVNTYFTYETNTFRLKSLQTTKSSTTLQNLEYAYDDADNVQSITDYLTSANSQTLGYDALNRLTSAAVPAYGGTIVYTYNEIGNLIRRLDVWEPNDYEYPASGAGSVRPHAAITISGNPYTYDANGNMLTGAGRTFTYDVENRPTSIVSGGQTTTFVYDGEGRRVKKQTGSSVVWYISKLYECDTTTCQKYIWSGDQRVAVKQVANGQLHFYHADHLGSTNVVTDSAGAEVQRVNYTPLGQVRGTIPPIAYKYTGKERDSETGLYWYEWRSYDPGIGRFTTPDTIVPKVLDPQALNRYTYVRNNPLRYTDPTGHDFGISLLVAVVVSAAVSAGTNAAIAAATGGNVGAAAKYGAVSGAITAGACSGGCGMVGTVVANAGAGAASSAAIGRDPGRGAMYGAAMGAALSVAPSPNWAANYGNQIVNDSLRGAAIGAGAAAIQGRNIGQGAWAGALVQAGGHQVTNLVGHSVGFVASGFQSPTYSDGAFVYPCSGCGGAITFGNTVTMNKNLHGALFDANVRPNSDFMGYASDIFQHELGHVSQYAAQGATFLGIYGIQLPIVSLTGHNPFIYNLNESFGLGGAMTSPQIQDAYRGCTVTGPYQLSC